MVWVNSDNRVCRSHIQVNSKLREETKKTYKNVIEIIIIEFYYCSQGNPDI